MKLLTTLIFLLSATAVSAAPAPPGPKIPKPPGLTFLYQLNITGGDSVSTGLGPRGNRIIAPILGGAFTGPKLKGTLLLLGGDWALEDANKPGTFSLYADARHTLKTDDGVIIQVFETGAIQPDGIAHMRLTFETGSEKYYWLNLVAGVGIMRLVGPNQLSLEAWGVVNP